MKHAIRILAVVAALAAPAALAWAGAPPAPATQTAADAQRKSAGCETCHTTTDRHTMHRNPGVILGCADCHGGDASVRASGLKRGDAAYVAAMRKAHVLPRDEKAWNWPSSATPERTYTLLNRESPGFVRFTNPGDLRVAREACGACHLAIVQASERSLMATTAMFWGAAAYNNGVLPYKHSILGEAYTREGLPASLANPVKPNAFMRSRKGILDSITAMPAWETVPPADIFRVFERGGRVISSGFPEIGLPNPSGSLEKLDEPGRPDIRQSNRGPGTGSRVAIPVLNVTKTRLNDPDLWFLGTEDQPGDYRSSGCSACHVVYANDRDPAHSAVYARYGHSGRAFTSDPTIPRAERGHPIRHEFTRAIPSSQCMVCHMHQPNVFVNSFYGAIMWDYESDAPAMWPRKQKYPTAEEARRILERNPEEAAIRGKWGDPGFLESVAGLNPTLKDTQFADYHGHGWNFRYVYKRDRKGELLDKDGRVVPDSDPRKFAKAVHLSSIHMDMGFQCVDCHFARDAHGSGHIYGEVAAAIEIDCADCHGTVDRYPTLRTSGPAAPPGGTDLSLLRTEDGRRRFEWRDGRLYQRSAVYPDLEWRVKLVKDTVTAGNPDYDAKAARAKLMHAGASGRAGEWGPTGAGYAHDNAKMTCYSCHTSWTTSCAGCHLPIQANWKTARNHYEGGETRNYATYNPQVARDDMFQLGVHGTAKNHRIAPIRSSSALVLSSTNINREHIYVQQPPISAAGFSSQAFAPHYPHTERTVETKTCSDCHLSGKDDNNAIMAQLLLQGTGFVNFIGLDAWLGEERDVEAVRVTEWDEPQAVIGSYLHRYAYPDWYAAHLKRERRLPEAHHHAAGGEVGCIALRGEYLYAAEGAGGLRVYDVASIANKGVSERIVTAPFSPLGHDTHVATKDATCVALPTNQPIDPIRNRDAALREANEEQALRPIYSYAVVADAREGLVLVNVETLGDGEPRNNFLTRALAWNPGGVLDGARHVTLGGDYAYVATPRGIAIVDLADPLKPRLAARVPLEGARASALQFRYLFVAARSGLEVIDVTLPEKPRLVRGAGVALADARRVYVARTYAYVAAGREGLAIVDVERPEHPRLVEKFTADGRIDDARDVAIGSTNASLFAYVADGRRGLAVVQLTAPDTQPDFYGFSPEPRPQLVAWRETRSPATAIARGLDRDRAVDETGGQVAVFGRVGSRPFTLEESRKLYLDPQGRPWTVKDTP
jgi:hypothetical protein